MTDKKYITEWKHKKDGKPCNAGFLAEEPFPGLDKYWWCTEHQDYLLPDGEYHTCHFCGEYVLHGYEYNTKRHWLSDCRPDLVKHEIGKTCTWWGMERDSGKKNCYAYQDRDTREWTDEHIHFYEDGPM